MVPCPIVLLHISLFLEIPALSPIVEKFAHNCCPLVTAPRRGIAPPGSWAGVLLRRGNKNKVLLGHPDTRGARVELLGVIRSPRGRRKLVASDLSPLPHVRTRCSAAGGKTRLGGFPSVYLYTTDVLRFLSTHHAVDLVLRPRLLTDATKRARKDGDGYSGLQREKGGVHRRPRKQCTTHIVLPGASRLPISSAFHVRPRPRGLAS